MITRFIIAAAVALFFTPTMSNFAQEHPEHPKKKEETKKGEHPKKGGEHPQKGEGKEVSTAEISTGIKKHISSESKNSSDKKFHVNHEGKDLALDLIRVHDDRLSSLGEGKYFACVDMKATDGNDLRHRFLHVGQAWRHGGDRDLGSQSQRQAAL